VALAWALRPALAVTFDYGQISASGEIEAATAVCHTLGLSHRVICIDCRSLGSGDLAGTTPIPVAPVPEWWPFRNQLLITFGAAIALQAGLSNLVIGAVSTDASHVDGRPEFFEVMNHVLCLQEGHLVLEAPALKDTTLSLCRRVGVPFDVLAWSHSCHVSSLACGDCRGCRKHRQCMRELGYGEY